MPQHERHEKFTKNRGEQDVVFGEDLSLLHRDNSAANMNIIRKLAINALKQTDFSDFTKAKNLSIAGRQMLCEKREECLDKAIMKF